jgi:hypothetical protein
LGVHLTQQILLHDVSKSIFQLTTDVHVLGEGEWLTHHMYHFGPISATEMCCMLTVMTVVNVYYM